MASETQSQAIGQDSAAITAAEQQLESAGATAMESWMLVQYPGLNLPVLKSLVGLFCSWASKFIVTNLDNLGYAIYVDQATGTQLTAFFQAQASGNQATIDQAGDNLIKLGNT